MSVREITITESSDENIKQKQKIRYLKIKCEICRERFSAIGSLYRHKKRKHNITGKNYNGRICPLCFESHETRKIYQDHLRDVHQQELQHETLQFGSMNEFNLWKERMEKETLSFFYLKSGGNSIYRYYMCNRSGIFKSQCSVREYRSHGSRKIGALCPAMIKLKCDQKNSKFTANFCSTHLGHDMDINHLNRNRRPEGFVINKKTNNKLKQSALLDYSNSMPSDISLIDHDYMYIPQDSELNRNKRKRTKSNKPKKGNNGKNVKKPNTEIASTQIDDIAFSYEDDVELGDEIETVFIEETTEEEIQTRPSDVSTLRAISL